MYSIYIAYNFHYYYVISQYSATLLLTFFEYYALHPLTGTVNLPSGTDIAVIIPGATENQQFGPLDVQIQLRSTAPPKEINSLHPLYDPLAYVLLYPEGHYGYHLALKHKEPNGRQGITATDFYRYHLQIRDPATHFNLFLRAGM